jgi:transposase-like protein
VNQQAAAELLDARMHRVLLDLSMLATVRAKKLSTDTATEQPDSQPPPGVANPAEIWRRRYERAKDDETREQVISEAREEVDSTRKRTAPLDPGQDIDLAAVVLEDALGFLPAEVSLRYNVSERWVRNARARAGRDPLTGQPTDNGHTPLTIPERRKEVARLMADRCGVRAMAQILKVSTFTISTDRRAVEAQQGT